MASTKMHLSKARINALDIPDKMLTVWDDEIAGFFLLVMPSGRRTFYLHRRTRTGQQFRFKIGRFGEELTVEQARVEARRICAAVALGRDPAAERRQARQGRKVRQSAPSVSELWTAFSEALKLKWAPNTLRSYSSWYTTHIDPVLGKLKAHEVKPADIRRMYRGIVQRSPATAEQVLRVTSSMYAWAVADDGLEIITANPCTASLDRNSKGPGANRRVREPEGDELERLVRAIEDRGDLIGVYFLLLILLACRGHELRGAAWHQFDLDVELPVWRKPAPHTKIKQPDRVTLSPPAVKLLDAVRQSHPFAPFSWLSYATARKEWLKTCAAAGITDLHQHDARHWHASLLAAEGYGLLDIGKALGHRDPRTTALYTHIVDSRQREAAGKVGEVVSLAGRRS